MYYCEHFVFIKKIIAKLDAVTISKAQHLFFTLKLKHNLIYIEINFSTLVISIIQLETSRTSLINFIDINRKITAVIQKAPNQFEKM